MTNKIPVGEVITQSYSFAFRNFLNNLGAIWIPILILVVLGELVISPMLAGAGQFVTPPPGAGQEAQAAAAQANIAIMAQMAPAWGVAILASLFFLPSAMVGVTREALGRRKGSAFLQNPFGKATFRYIGALLLVMLIWIVASILFVIAMVLLGIGAGALGVGAGDRSAGPGAGAIITGILVIILSVAAMCAFAYGLARLTFFIAPVVVGEETLGLRRSWQLGRGNFWRMIGAGIATFVPLLFVSVIVAYFINGADFLSGLDPSLSQAERLAANRQMLAEMTERRQNYWFILIPVSVLYYVLFISLMSGISAFSYREVTQGTAQAPETVF